MIGASTMKPVLILMPLACSSLHTLSKQDLPQFRVIEQTTEPERSGGVRYRFSVPVNPY